MTRPLVMAAPNGMRRSKAEHPAIPITISETVATAMACRAAGANALHLHVRDARGHHTLDTGLYREALAELDRNVPGMPVQVTTEAGGVYDVADQLTLVEDLKPRWISLSLREAFRDKDLARRLYAVASEQGTVLQHIVYDTGDAGLLAHWQEQGAVSESTSVILVLGRYTADQASVPEDLRPLLDCLPPVGRWMTCAFGPNEHACLLHAAMLGGDLRVGFENSCVRADGTPWPDMAASVSALCGQLP